MPESNPPELAQPEPTPPVPYGGPVIDSHIHLWDLGGDHYPWLMPQGSFGPSGRFDTLKRNYLLDDYRRDCAGQNVVASVHIEALWSADESPVNETRWLETLDKSDNVAVRYVAGAPFGRPHSEALLREQAQFERVVGVRQVLAWHPEPTKTMVSRPELSREPCWRQSLAVVDELNLVLELLIYPWQSREVVELAELHPQLTIVVDHLGSPIDRSAEGVSRWAADIELLATASNIVLKVSSVAGYTPSQSLAEVSVLVNRAVDTFGAERCMFGSDFPVGGLDEMSYARVYDQYRSSVLKRTAAQQFALFCGTASRVYRIPLEHSEAAGPAPIRTSRGAYEHRSVQSVPRS